MRSSKQISSDIPSVDEIKEAIEQLDGLEGVANRHTFDQSPYSLIRVKNNSNEPEYYLFEAKPIGTGSYGKIYKGFNVKIDNRGEPQIEEQEIVLKEMQQALTKENEVKIEVDVLKRFAPISHEVRDDVNYYIIQPFIKGDDLMKVKTEQIDQKPKDKLCLSDIVTQLTLPQRLEVIEKIYENLEKLHSSQGGIRYIHGDIKGQNIKLHFDKEKNEISVTLMDFGTAIPLTDRDREMPKTAEVVGSPFHLDPLNVDFRLVHDTTDVLALTGVVASILNAEDPYSAKEKKLDEKIDPQKKEEQNPEIATILTRYQKLIDEQSNKEEKENLVAERQAEVREVRHRIIQKNKQVFAEKLARGDNLKEFRDKKHSEVEAEYSFAGLGDGLNMEAKDKNLVENFLKKTQGVFENKEDYRIYRPSASQGKVFFALIRNLYTENLTPEQKDKRRSIIEKIITSPKLDDANYNEILKTINNLSLKDNNKKNDLLENQLNHYTLFTRTKNLVQAFDPLVKILQDKKGNKTEDSIKALNVLVAQIGDDKNHRYFKNADDVKSFQSLVNQWKIELKPTSRISFFGPSSNKRKEHIRSNIQGYIASLKTAYAEEKKESFTARRKSRS